MDRVGYFVGFLCMFLWSVAVVLWAASSTPGGIRIEIGQERSAAAGCPCGKSCQCADCNCVCEGGVCPIDRASVCPCKCCPKPIGSGVAE